MKIVDILDMITPWPTTPPSSPAYVEQAGQALATWARLGVELAQLDDASPLVHAIGEALLTRPRTYETGGGWAWDRYMLIASRPAVAAALEQALRTAPALPSELVELSRNPDEWWAALGRLALELRGIPA